GTRHLIREIGLGPKDLSTTPDLEQILSQVLAICSDTRPTPTQGEHRRRPESGQEETNRGAAIGANGPRGADYKCRALTLHESGTFVKFTQAGANLFA